MAMDVKIVSAGAVAGRGPILNVQALTTETMVGEYANLPPGKIQTIEVVGAEGQHNKPSVGISGVPVIGSIDVAGASRGQFKLRTDFKAVKDKARLQFRFIDKRGGMTVKDASMDVYAHFDGERIVLVQGPKEYLSVELISISAHLKPESKKIDISFGFQGLSMKRSHDIQEYILTMGMGPFGIGRGIMPYVKGCDSAYCSAFLNISHERFMGTVDGYGIRVNPILRAMGSNGKVLAESHSPFSLGDFKKETDYDYEHNETGYHWTFHIQ